MKDLKKELEGIDCTLKIISEKAQGQKKQDYVLDSYL